MTVVTRFAPSPTGFLHIGSARTALFNWLYARHHKGKFLLRVEDTDRERSTQAAVDAILDGLSWLGLDWDGDEIHQFSRKERHVEVVKQLLCEERAYYCYCSKEELDQKRVQAQKEKRSYKYDGTCRRRSKNDVPKGIEPVVRLKAEQEGETVIEDVVQGQVVVKNSQLDDMVLLRADGTPTYMLAVVVDDHDMGVTHVIRGDDHLTNAARQRLLYQALGWDVPQFAHIPLIHGNDGAKLSKRHGALGVEAYRDMGYLPEALRNYLLRLGWSHGDDEVISTEQAIKWFDLDHIGKSPARFDFDKLDNINGHYMRQMDDDALLPLLCHSLHKLTGKDIEGGIKTRLSQGLSGLKQRAKNLKELADNSLFYVSAPVEYSDKASQALAEGKALLQGVVTELEQIDNWEHDNLEMALKKFSEAKDVKLGKLMAPIRAAITGSHVSPSMFEVMEVLGKDETMLRLNKIL